MQIHNNFNFLNRYNFSGTQQKEISIANFIDEKNIVDTFVTMVKMDTSSNERKAPFQTPSSYGQRVFANWLKEILIKLNVEDVKLDKNCFLTGKISSNLCSKHPKIALFAHMDTKKPGKNVFPQIHNYKNGPIFLENGEEIPEYQLINHKNKKIITTNGETILGADDKAGIAEILESIRLLKTNPNIKHPEVKLVFTPDEECGGFSAISKFPIKEFGADYGYTIDGDSPHIVEKENYFNPYILIANIKHQLFGLTHPGVSIAEAEEYKKSLDKQEGLSRVYEYAIQGLKKAILNQKSCT